MILYSYINVNLILSVFVIAILAGPASAECRDKNCMADEYTFQDDQVAKHTFFYNSVFNIGTNWYLIFDYPSDKDTGSISFEFSTGLSKVYSYDADQTSDSISFSGSSFTEEVFNLDLYVNFTESDSGFILSIDVNKPPAEDMFYLWGGMTVFWLAIGAYTLYISNKFRDLSNKLGGYDNDSRKKN